MEAIKLKVLSLKIQKFIARLMKLINDEEDQFTIEGNLEDLLTPKTL